jgi:hypothetical protein
MISVADSVTLDKIDHALRICGDYKTPTPSGLTVRHLRRADITECLAPVLNKCNQN